MGFIKIDEELQLSDELSDVILGLITSSSLKIPKISIAALFLAKSRPGLDPTVVASTINSRLTEAGIPTGPLVDGAPNSMEIYSNILCEEMFSAMQEDMRVDVMCDPGQQVTAFGANAGGPIVVQGSNIAPWLGIGVAV